ncbi:hypothetical protein M970_061110 [Encephalitozoon cuniculi EcunIII-L]|nr:hypothetical protein M970_061110 [Encephalitozoon cuniculi EcunIII-L]UYI27710.1 hypothetical protein J0A71_07g15900 [Encephalitozoon cuniculi]
MQKAKDLFMEEVRSVHDSDIVKRWYSSYLEGKACSKSRFKDVLSIIMPSVEDMEILESTAVLFEISQEVADGMSLKDTEHSYENSMEIISIFALYSSIFSIIQRYIRDKDLGSRIADLYSDVSMRLNVPGDGTWGDLEGRRRFFFDFYLPVKIYSAFARKDWEMRGREEEFARMYSSRRRGRDWDGTRMDRFYEEMSCGDGKVCKALRFLFDEAYGDDEQRMAGCSNFR